MGPDSSSIVVQLRCQYLQEACLDSSSCSPQIHQHPKAGVTSLLQQLHCITYYLLLYRIHSELAHVLFFASGLFLLLFPLSGRLFFKTVTHLTPLLHSGLCSVVTSSWRPSQITPSNTGPSVPYLLSISLPCFVFSIALNPT